MTIIVIVSFWRRMKNIKTGRVAKAKGVSLPPEVFAWAQRRIEDNRPRLIGFSHYVRSLIDADMQWDVLGIGKVKGRKRPFERPLTPFSDNAIAA